LKEFVVIMDSTFKKKLHLGELLIGTILTLPSTEIGEIYAGAGFDWVFIDLEHGVLDLREAQQIVQSASPRVPCVLRVPANDDVWIKKALDIGPAGLIIPSVNTAEEAEKAVWLCKYPPEGTRSVGIARAQGYGENFQGYIQDANQSTVVILQIEHQDGIDNIDSILSVSGIDCLFIGPYDLSASMEKIGQVSDPEVQQAIRYVEKRAKRVGMPLGIFCASVEAARPFVQRGYSLFAIGIDIMLISRSAKNIVGEMKVFRVARLRSSEDPRSER
jgi:2-dehydro-3-deoxyglucarate aldolase/4-hydroxy-2-oxoheptanedioate aldolase